jgi:hypothetical protein
MSTAAAETLVTDLPGDPGFGATHRFDGAALYVDVRRSLEILDYVREHFGAPDSDDLFRRYQTDTIHVIKEASGARCLRRGDAVLATVEGPDSAWRAVEAARAAIELITRKFEPEYLARFSCEGSCGIPGCAGSPRFEVCAGIDVGPIGEYRQRIISGEAGDVQGSAVSLAAKLTKRVLLPYSMAITRSAFSRLPTAQSAQFEWSHRNVKIGNRFRAILVTKLPS